MLRVGQRRLVACNRGAESLPGDGETRRHQDFLRIAKCVGVGQSVLERHAHILERNLRVLDDAERGFARNELRVEAGHPAFDDVATDVAIVATRPDDDVIGERRVANPTLVAIQHVGVAVTPRARFEHAHVGTVVWLGESECADLLQSRHRWEEALLLFFGTQQGNRHHGQGRLHTHKRRQTQIAPS